VTETNWSEMPVQLGRAATNILTKIRNFRDLRTCQKGPESDQKGT